MTVECYRVVGFQQLSDDRIEVETYSLGPDNTNIKDLLRLAAPSIRRESSPGLSTDIADLEGDHSARYEVAPDEMADALALLESHREPVVTAIGIGCDVSVCLDFTRSPVEGKDLTEWQRSELGRLVSDAKYWPNALAKRRQLLVSRMASYLKTHPFLGSLDGIAAIPGFRGANSLVQGIASGVSQALQVPVVPLRRSKSTQPQKNVEAERSQANQKNTMSVSLQWEHRLIVVIDDFMRHADTLREANRALRVAGANSVGAVTLIKDIKGTSRYKF